MKLIATIAAVALVAGASFAHAAKCPTPEQISALLNAQAPARTDEQNAAIFNLLTTTKAPERTAEQNAAIGALLSAAKAARAGGCHACGGGGGMSRGMASAAAAHGL